MTRIKALIIGLSLFICPMLSLHATGTPTPPDGFQWKQVPEIKAAFLVPDGWHYYQQRDGKTFALFITKENIPDNKYYDTGVGINVFQNNPSAPAQLKDMFDSIRKTDGMNIRTLYTGVINSNTNTSYLIIFESPVDAWDKNWPLGEKIVNYLALESEI